ncbi:hypothetical protein CLV58_101186 [Spirosoma oryzae]|uniref:DUF2975 family protein n=1 Tax=Spirosoma oryzae TaxID=1469603 RepID=A0A2T0TN29_9BACT|nr:hypothetical protein [Spirosoma oryzae]PRY47120.1 hypothetical protein CLV58_101186 [Spirosoma oryzae]
MKIINVLFWGVSILIGLECLLFTYRGVSIIGEYSGVLRWMWVFKIATYMGIVAIGFLVFRMKKTFNKRGFLELTSVKQLRSVGLLALVVAMLNSFANAGMDTWHYYKKEVSFQEAQGQFTLYLFEHIFDHSLIIYVLVLSILMLSYFAQNAIAVKRENEAFI